ncbi:universal stress protein [Halostagnicola kamekurae]|uniref:Nucleotide-binding universal stress protein, UspA family n=1 Tax=Halostagnicola kamekurae TaxID=619731 RepID=A0A1I6TWC0_9EURY|nr:universal stress protein [Halostagnicola kamekurae]SFS93297.1 Nucleotide-binding universal stress protein, UspA family [Halostagnicola kamekurae]
MADSSARGSILVPIANPETADRLVSTAADLATDTERALELLTVVEVPSQVPLSEGERLVEDEREVLEYAADIVSDRPVEVTKRIRFARSVSSGICSAAADQSVETILVGWRGNRRRRDIVLGSHIDEVLREAPCDVLVKRMDDDEPIREILLPVAGGPNTELAADVAGSLARVHEAAIHVVVVHSPGGTERSREEKEAALASVIGGLTGVPVITQEIIESESVADALVDRSEAADLVVLGATSTDVFRRSVIGSLPERVGRRATSSVIMVKANRTIRSRLRRLVSRLPFG